MLQPDPVRRNLPYILVAALAAVILGGGIVGIARATQPEPLVQRVVKATPPSTPRPAAPPPTATAAPPSVSSSSDTSPQMAALVASLPPGSVSVAARNLTTGATFTYGSSGGQTAASIVKLDILETLLLQRQAAGGHLTADQDSEATSMIEDSDDDAASDLWQDIGGGSELAAANRRLGVRCTVPGPGSQWGLTTTCARDQVQLLYQLESDSSPLEQARRDYILNLMDNVVPSQAWGVPVVADDGTEYSVKNGWLNLNGDTDWAVNSDGIVTYHGQTLLIAVLSQNNETVYTGVQLIQQLAPLAAEAVTTT